MTGPADEIKRLQGALLLIYGARYRIKQSPAARERGEPLMVYVNEESWFEAFGPLQVPPANRLYWEITQE